MTGAKMELPRRFRQRRAIVVDVTHEAAAAAALDLDPLPLDPPVIEGFEEGHDLVLFLEVEFGGVDDGEGEGAFVASLEVEIRWVEVVGVEVEVVSAFDAVVD